MTSTKAIAAASVSELEALVSAVDDEQLAAVARVFVEAPRLFFSGVGRSGLSARAVAMRLMHIGKVAYVVGEATTPAIAQGDAFIMFTSSGRGSILDQAKTAQSRTARLVSFTSAPNELSAMSEAVVEVPARTRVPTHQHAGSLFEQGCLIIGDALCRTVQETMGVPSTELDARHANIL